MKFFRQIVLSSYIAVMAFNTSAIASEAPNSAQLDADGFSIEMNDPRYTKLKTYLVEMKDGVLTPAELVVPEKTKFRLVVRNLGNKPAEFESNQLRQEKVLFMNAETTLAKD